MRILTPYEQRAKDFAIAKHNATNCTYAGEPYSVHLQHVVDVASSVKGSTNFTMNDFDEVIYPACWLHDTMEDCRVNYSEIEREFGKDMAEIVFNLTNELGRDRKERALRTYTKINRCYYSLFVKLCDRIANTEFSKTDQPNGMYRKYVQEYPMFRYSLFNKNNDDMILRLWSRLDTVSGFKCG